MNGSSKQDNHEVCPYCGEMTRNGLCKSGDLVYCDHCCKLIKCIEKDGKLSFEKPSKKERRKEAEVSELYDKNDWDQWTFM